MSLMAAIDTAVRLQLANDKPGSALNYAAIMKTATTATPAGFGFDESSMLQFLEQVACRLKLDTPSLNYDWPRTDTQKGLNSSLALLVRLIACDTMPAQGAKP